jgi:GT2 family glycosyltransferase
MTAEHAPVSVVIPTIGRKTLLGRCLESLFACRPLPREILIVDQGRNSAVGEVARSPTATTVRTLSCEKVGIAAGVNLGLRHARFDFVLGTHDDCTVEPSWVATGLRYLSENDGAVITGRVRSPTTERVIPSTKDDPASHRFRDTRTLELYPNNMALHRPTALAIGGFDERLTPAAEDNDFCYRWLRAGGTLHYAADFVAWHHDWRSPEELEKLYVAYAYSSGLFYAKHLRRGDLYMLRYIARDVSAAIRGELAGLLGRTPQSEDWRQGVLRGLPGGLVQGWRRFGPRSTGWTPS